MVLRIFSMHSPFSFCLLCCCRCYEVEHAGGEGRALSVIYYRRVCKRATLLLPVISSSCALQNEAGYLGIKLGCFS